MSELACSGNSGIDQRAIQELTKLEKLYIKNNTKIKDINFLKNTLRISHRSNNLKTDELTKLIELNKSD